MDAWLSAFQQSTVCRSSGRLAYNLALSYEVIGNLDKAKEWATTAYVTGGERNAQWGADTLTHGLPEEAIFTGSGRANKRSGLAPAA